MLNRLWWDRRLVFGLLTVLALALMPNVTRAYDIPARAAILIEHETGQVLYAKNPDTPLPPASMSNTRQSGFSLRRWASADPAEPSPIHCTGAGEG